MRKDSEHWRRGDKTAHPDCTACLACSKFGTEREIDPDDAAMLDEDRFDVVEGEDDR